MTFSGDLNRAVTNMQCQADRRVRRVAFAAFQAINGVSPVDKGTFRENWNVSIDTIDRSADMARTTADHAETVSKATVVVSGAKTGDTVYISNSVPYANKLEGGYSPQAPAGVVEPAVTRIKNAIEDGRL